MAETNSALADDITAPPDVSGAEALYGLRPALVRAVSDAAEVEDAKLVRRLIYPLHYSDVADLLERLRPDIRRRVVDYTRRTLPPETLTELDYAVLEEVLEVLDAKQLVAAVRDLDTDDAVELLSEVDADVQREVLDSVDAEDRELIREGLAYPEYSAGRLMQRDVVSVVRSWTVGQTIDYMRESDELPDDFYDIFVIDRQGHPIGHVPLNKLLRTRRPVRIAQIMDEDITTIPVTLDQEDVAKIFRDRDLVSAPVIDASEKLVGMITVDDIVDVIDEEAEEDMLRMHGVQEIDFYHAALDTTKARFSWLAINLLTAIAASVVIGFFADTIGQIVALAVLMPIVASMGGNSGTQTLTVAVRAIAMREFTQGNILRFVFKELFVGAVNGVIFAILIALIGGIWFNSWLIGLVIGLAMVINLIVAGLAGAMIPITLDRRGIDPAIASTVILTTVTDIVGFLTFLGLATVIIL